MGRISANWRYEPFLPKQNTRVIPSLWISTQRKNADALSTELKIKIPLLLGVGGSIPKYRYFRYYVTFQNIDTRANRIDTFILFPPSPLLVNFIKNYVQTNTSRPIYALFFSLHCCPPLLEARARAARSLPERRLSSWLTAASRAGQQQPATRECDTHTRMMAERKRSVVWSYFTTVN